MSARVKRRSSVSRTSPLDAAQRYLQRDAERSLRAARPLLRPRGGELAQPPTPLPPAAPTFGSTAPLAAAVLALREELARATGDRRRAIESHVRSGSVSLSEARAAVKSIEAEEDAHAARIEAARGTVAQIKQAIRAQRTAGAPAAAAERALKKFQELFPDADRPALPWGCRPPAGSRVRLQPAPPTRTPADVQRGWVEKIVERLL